MTSKEYTEQTQGFAVVGTCEQRSPRWEDVIDHPAFRKLVKDEHGIYEVHYRDLSTGEFQRIASGNATNLTDVWAGMCSKWGDDWDGVG